MKPSPHADILATFDRARLDVRTDAPMRRVLAQIMRHGRIGELAKLALMCQVGRSQIDRVLADLTDLGYLAGDIAAQMAAA